MKEKIFNNFSLKILSAICAIILWAVIVNIYDPTIGFTITGVSVQMINSEALTNKDYSYEVVDGSKISVYISGPKSIVTDITASDIVATADLSKVTTFADYVDIDVKAVKDGRTLSTVEVTPKTTAVKLNIENRVTQTFNVEFNTTGQVGEGYVITGQSISPNTIKITGPSSVMSDVAHVRANVNLNDAVDDITDNVEIALYDTNDNQINDDKLELSKTDVDYTATVRPCKEVPVKYGISGSAASGYSVSAVEVNPEKIILAGTKETLDGISEIVIPSDAIVIDGITSDTTFHVLVSNYLPNNVKLVSDNYITVKVSVSNSGEKTIGISPSDINVKGMGQNLKCTFVTDNAVNVKVTGDGSVNSYDASDLEPYIDLTGLTEGDHTVKLAFNQPQGCTISGDYMIQVKIINTQAATQPESESGKAAGNAASG